MLGKPPICAKEKPKHSNAILKKHKKNPENADVRYLIAAKQLI